jgi:hypothetical protein
MAPHAEHRSPSKTPPRGCRPRHVNAGATTIRAKVLRWARGPIRRLSPLTAHMRIMSKRSDGNYWSFGFKKTRIVP